MTIGKYDKNKTIKKGYHGYFLVLAFDAFIIAMSDIMDTALSGSLFDLKALAAVGICGLYCTIIYMITNALTQGYGLAMGKIMARGNVKETNVVFTQALGVQITICTVLAIIAFVFAGPIVHILGARDLELEVYAVPYLRMVGLSCIFIAPNQVFRKGMLLYGYKKECSILGILEIVVNLLASLFFSLVCNMGVAGLALGTASGKLASSLYLYICCRCNPRGLTICLSKKNFIHNFKMANYNGLPMCTADLGDILLGTILNNVIAYTSGTMGLAVFALYKSIRKFGKVVSHGSVHSLSVLSSTLYGSKDVDGLETALKTAHTTPAAVSVGLSVLMLIFRIPILHLFGCTQTELYPIMTSAFIWLIFRNLLRLVQKNICNFYNFTNNVLLSMLLSFEVDVVINIPLSILTLKIFGIRGIWIGDALTYVVFLFLNILLFCLKKHRLPKNIRDIMFLPKDFYKSKNLLNISVIVQEQTKFSIVEQVEAFLKAHGYTGKTAGHCSLCLEELLVRTVKGGATVIDIRLFVSEGLLKFTIRDDALPNNHMVFEPEDIADGAGIRIVKKMARDVRYTYVAGFNVLDVDI